LTERNLSIVLRAVSIYNYSKKSK